MNDEHRTIGEGMLSHLQWLVTHPTHTALANGGAATVLGMTLHAGLDYALFAGALAAAATAAVNLTFRYAAPIADAMGKAHAARWTPAPIAPAGPPRVLVVEDEETGQMVAAHAAESVGLVVEHAFTARAALSALARDRGIALVLLDLRLPDSGQPMAFAREIRAAAPPGVRIVVLSAIDAAPKVAEAIGATCLMKPASPDIIADAMRAALA